jgi:hypothetical protein
VNYSVTSTPRYLTQPPATVNGSIEDFVSPIYGKSSLQALAFDTDLLLVTPGLENINLPVVGDMTFLGAMTIEYSYVPTSAVPVPAAAWLFGSALISLAGIKRKK